MTNPFKAVLDIRRHELPLALLMFSYFFLVITSFWILKPIKKALFIQFYDSTGFTLLNWHMTASQAELVAKVLNMVVAIVAVIAFTWLSRHFRRQQKLCRAFGTISRRQTHYHLPFYANYLSNFP